jgi:hypothetical protein
MVSDGWVSGLRRLAERTPPYRDRYVDLLRAVAIAAVVTGHWLAAVVTYDQAGLDGESALGVLEWARWLSWLFQVMPVFFLVGGYANAASLRAAMRRGDGAEVWLLGRTARLLRSTTALLVAVAVAALIARLVGVEWELIGTAAWLATIPLWFLVVYIAVVVLAPAMHAFHRRWGLNVVAVLVLLVVLGDVARFGFDMPHGADANYLLVWLAVHQVGFAWQDGSLPARPAFALPLAAGGLAGLVLATVYGPYPLSMVAVPGADQHNTAPPTLALLFLAAAQTGLALLLQARANRWLQRRGPWMIVVGVNTVVLTMFLWHMTAVAVAAVALYPTGIFPQPGIGTASWYAWRLPWLGCLSVVLAFLLLIFGRIEAKGGPGTAGRAADRSTPQRSAMLTATIAVGTAAVLAGLLSITFAGPAYHSPTGLPPGALLAYLPGSALLRWARRSIR